VRRATIYVRRWGPRGVLIAKSPLDAVAPRHSARARERRQPITAALETRPGSDHRDLARLARKIAAGGPQTAA